jgi:PTS system galactitol-specific IIA component
MQYTLPDLLRVEHILLDLDASDSSSAIRLLNELLVRTSHTAPEFADDVCTRERTFPTGLPTRPVAVAIPHADPPHVKASAVALGVLRSPVQFAQMGTDGSVKLDAHAVFLLAIKEQEKQVEMIQQLVKVIQNAELLESLMKVAGSQEALDLILASLK